MRRLLTALIAVISAGGGIALATAPAAHAATPGNFAATGHDMDFHCSGGSTDECNYMRIVLNKVRNGSTKPILALDQGSEVPTAVTDIGGEPAVTTVDPTSPAFATTKFVGAGNVPLWSAIITASDSSCGGCDNTPAGEAKINARKADFATFLDNGGGILALTGADNFATYYDFMSLPNLGGAPVSAPFTVTAAGAAQGVTTAMANCCATHSSFKVPPSPPWTILETDSAKLAETIQCNGCGSSVIGGGGGHAPNIFELDVKRCTTIHIGYNYFPVGTVIHWRVNQTGRGTLATGSYTTVAPTGKTMHFADLTRSLSLKSGLHTHIYFRWTISGVITKYVLTRGPACS
ncbi:MAG: hypothetical protein QOG65_3292 [Actinomycetota bacterium]|nr:hypothetical protein [Actinomycetota bacterium]